MPPPMILPKVTRSARTPKYSWAPPGARRKPVITSSKISRAPCLSHRARRPSRKPGAGPTTPMLAATGSTITAATWPGFCSSRASTLAKSLNWAVRVSLAAPTGTPALLGWPPARAEEPALTSIQSEWPW